MMVYKPIDKDYVLKLVQEKGPLIPIHLRKDLDTDTIMIGAVLSQLVSEGKVKVTSVKIGGTPLYYTPGSEDKLANFMRYLNEKDRRAAELLQEQKVLKEVDQDPLVRVCLRNIKDYAKPLEVNVKGQKEIYWKWYLMPTQEAEAMILKNLKEEEARQAPPVEQTRAAPEQKPVQKQAPASEKAVIQAAPSSGNHPIQARVDEKKKETVAEKPKTHKRDVKEDRKAEEVQERLGKPKESLDAEKDSFFQEVRRYLYDNSIVISDYKILRKTEIDLYVSVPTRLGSQEYFCKAKSKKRVNDGDLSSAYIQGQNTKLPILFLTPGELTKKAKDMLDKEFKGMTVKRI
ncbi:hypothetical protein JW826_05425 [Candidatus Woesearchaeota archaeon]|nr:hypothetical protein [Candidatus Woesearchaeota archaeon]